MATMTIRDTSLFVEVLGRGDPLVLMHGGPGLDHVSLSINGTQAQPASPEQRLAAAAPI